MRLICSLVLCALTAPMALAQEVDASVGAWYRDFEAVSNLARDDASIDGYLALQYGDFGFELSTSQSDQLTSSLFAAHYDLSQFAPAGNWNYGVVIGQSFGNLETPFAGVEGGYIGDKLSATARASYWFDSNFSNGWRADLDLAYQFHPDWSVYYGYSHYEFDDGNMLADDYQTGIRYHLGDAARIELGFGEIHPKIIPSNREYIWSQYSIGLFYDFGKGMKYERMRPVFSSIELR